MRSLPTSHSLGRATSPGQRSSNYGGFLLPQHHRESHTPISNISCHIEILSAVRRREDRQTDASPWRMGL